LDKYSAVASLEALKVSGMSRSQARLSAWDAVHYLPSIHEAISLSFMFGKVALGLRAHPIRSGLALLRRVDCMHGSSPLSHWPCGCSATAPCIAMWAHAPQRSLLIGVDSASNKVLTHARCKSSPVWDVNKQLSTFTRSVKLEELPTTWLRQGTNKFW